MSWVLFPKITDSWPWFGAANETFVVSCCFAVQAKQRVEQLSLALMAWCEFPKMNQLQIEIFLGCSRVANARGNSCSLSCVKVSFGIKLPRVFEKFCPNFNAVQCNTNCFESLISIPDTLFLIKSGAELCDKSATQDQIFCHRIGSGVDEGARLLLDGRKPPVPDSR